MYLLADAHDWQDEVKKPEGWGGGCLASPEAQIPFPAQHQILENFESYHPSFQARSPEILQYGFVWFKAEYKGTEGG